jgi:hypothetical protein
MCNLYSLNKMREAVAREGFGYIAPVDVGT